MRTELDNPSTLPAKLRDRLAKYDPAFRRLEFLEQVIDVTDINELIADINEHCARGLVYGYHFTRAFPGEIRAQGLTIRSGEQIRSDFLAKYGHRFSDEEIKAIQSNWDSYFGPSMAKSRDGRIFFNFTKSALKSGGAAPLLRNFGGEQVYFCIDEMPGVGTKLRQLGEPLIIKCALRPEEVNVYHPQTWGQIVTSSYHRLVNPKAHQCDTDGWQAKAVPPEMVEIILATEPA